MADAPGARRVVRFGDIEADAASGEIVRAGRRIPLADQPMRILMRLTGRPGTVVSRDELRRELWSDDTFVDFEHGLNSAVKRLRDALGDSADVPRYIETIPRRGYRFIGDLDTVAGPDAVSPRPAAAGADSISWTVRYWLLAGLLLAVGLGAWGWHAFLRTAPDARQAAAPPVSGRILVAALEPGNGERPLSAVGRLAADRLIATISRIDTAEVLPTSVGSRSSEETVAAAGRLGAALAVEIVAHTLAQQQFFEARIHDARTREVLYFSPRFEATVAQPGPAVERVAQAVAGAVAVHLDHGFGGLQVTSEPPVLDAYLEYRAGADLLEKDYPRAIAQLQRAASMSPGYLLPRLTLVMAYDNQGDQARTSAQMAQIADSANRLSAAERLLVEYMTESLAQRSESALRALLDAEKLAPRSWIVNYGIQQEALRAHRPRLAIDAFGRLPLYARDRRYNAWRLAALARALHLVGDYAREVGESRRAQEYEPGNALYAVDEVRGLAGLGNTQGITEVIDRVVATPVTVAGPALVMERAARELRAHGHLDASRGVANRSTEWLRSRMHDGAADGGQRAALARMLYIGERWAEAEAVFARLAAERPEILEYTAYLGVIAARRHDAPRARAVADRLQRWPGGNAHGRSTYWRAAIASLLGEHDQAVNLLRQAFGEGHGRGLGIHESPDFEAVRESPAFRALVAPRD